MAEPREIYAVSITIRIVFGFMLIALIWEFDFSAFMVLIIAILNNGTIMTISKDRVKSWCASDDCIPCCTTDCNFDISVCGLDLCKGEGYRLGMAGVIWIYSIVTYFPHDLLKFSIRYILSGKAWIVDPKLASYGIESPIYAVVQLAQTTMRSELGKITLRTSRNEILSTRR